MVIKKDGKVLSSMTHTLSDGGKTQTIKGTETKPDGTTSDFNVVLKKVSGGSGWGGTWESTDVKFTSPDEWDIEAYDGDGLTFNTAAYQDTMSMKFDGKDYEEKGPNVAPGSTSAGKRVNAHTLDLTDKVKGQVMDHTKFEVSQDGKTLTLPHDSRNRPAESLDHCLRQDVGLAEAIRVREGENKRLLVQGEDRHHQEPIDGKVKRLKSGNQQDRRDPYVT
jgi:hypothetical protein